MKPWILGVISVGALGASLLPLAGCEALAAPFLLWGPEPTKTVPAEYPYLANKRVAVVIWADDYTQFEFPHVRLELGEHITEAIKGNVPGARVVPTRDVIDAQDRDPEWARKPPAAIGEKVRADRVLMVELSQYTTREPDSPHLLRGRISANVKLYDVERPGAMPLYNAVIDAVYPESSMPEYGAREDAVRQQAMQAFAASAAGKFHDRKVKVK